MSILRKAILSGLALAAISSSAMAGDNYRLSITNLTKGQIFSPLFVATHRGNTELFKTGEAVSPELAMVAQDAKYDDLVAAFNSTPGVRYVTVGDGVILPGQTVSMDLPAMGKADFVSFATMLVTTNDAFTGASKVRFVGEKSVSLMLPAYDAGSEANSESCEHIPGPPCGVSEMAPAEAAEGYVHIHNGIHGHGDLAPSTFDWNNPVAKVTIQLVDN